MLPAQLCAAWLAGSSYFVISSLCLFVHPSAHAQNHVVAKVTVIEMAESHVLVWLADETTVCLYNLVA